jgi:hypothetical protein
MGVLRPWHIFALGCPVLVCAAVVTLVVFLILRIRDRQR